MVDYSVCIPVYNSEKTLEDLYTRISSVFKAITDNYEIILVDDGSRDSSWEIMKKLHTKDQRVKVVSLTKNFGQHNALMCAFNFVRGEKIITMDDDLQHPPEEIPKLISCYKENKEVDGVLGAPKVKKHNLIRRISSLIVDKTNNLVFKKPSSLKMSPFRLLRREIVEELIKNKIHNPALGSLLMSTTLNLKNVTVKHNERSFGKSGYVLRKAISLAVDNVVNYSTIPLKLISIFGIFCSLSSLAGVIFFIYRRLVEKRGPEGWTSLLVVNLFFFGMVLFSMGVIGEYLIRIIRQVNQQPQFIIRRKLI